MYDQTAVSTLKRAANKMRTLAEDPRLTALVDPAAANGIAAWLDSCQGDYRATLDPDECVTCGEYCCDPIQACGCHPGDALMVARAILGSEA